MCVYIDEIEKKVSEFVESSLMFTAWDVTVALRKDGNSVHHHEVKSEVHKMFRNGSMSGYSRILARLPNVNVQPWIYYPSSYSADDVVKLYFGTPTGSPSSISSLDFSDNDSDNVIYKLDNRNRLCIPADLVREAGWTHGDQVFVKKENNELVISKNSDANVTSYTVDTYDNVRISGAVLAASFGCNGVVYEIKKEGQEIRVKKYA